MSILRGLELFSGLRGLIGLKAFVASSGLKSGLLEPLLSGLHGLKGAIELTRSSSPLP